MRACVFASSQKHELWILDELFELLSPHGSDGTIDDAMVRTESHVHQGCNLELIVGTSSVLVDNDTFLGATHSQDAGLGRVNDS